MSRILYACASLALGRVNFLSLPSLSHYFFLNHDDELRFRLHHTHTRTHSRRIEFAEFDNSLRNDLATSSSRRSVVNRLHLCPTSSSLDELHSPFCLHLRSAGFLPSTSITPTSPKFYRICYCCRYSGLITSKALCQLSDQSPRRHRNKKTTKLAGLVLHKFSFIRPLLGPKTWAYCGGDKKPP